MCYENWRYMATPIKQNEMWEHGTVSQIPRNSLIMIMAAFAMVILPHIYNISVWIIAASLACVIWRWLIFIGKTSFPSFWMKVALVSISAAAVVISEGITKNLETWAALLVMAFALKLLEMKTRRDAYVVVFLSYFIISVEFIFNNSMSIVAYELFAIGLVTAAMVGMNQFHTRVKPIESIKIASRILAQAIPLMVVVFIIFPRIGPIWAIATPSQKARTGLSSEMTPGDIASLARSDEIVFRAIFNEAPPSSKEMYWRGRVYANFEKGTWSQAIIPKKHRNIPRVYWGHNKNQGWFIPDLNNLEKRSYTILQEPSFDRWLFGLDLAYPRTKSVGVMWDYRITSRAPIQTLFQYKIDTYPNAQLNTWLPEFLRIQTTSIDVEDNPRAVNFAQVIYAQSNSTEEFVNKILDHVRNQPYHYTLEPPILNRSGSIDQFWFDTRQGFCTHYAGAFVYIMRAAGIPARMVGGYQGGEINPLTGHTVVRQYMAHAWAEIWMPDKGWTRVDPTAAVAPSRIQDGLSAALPEDDLSSLSAFTNARISGAMGLGKIMYLMESLEHRWNLFVIGYNSNMQSDFLEKLLGKVTMLKTALVLFAGALLSAAFVAITLLLQKGRKSRHPVIRIFQLFTTRVAKHGLQRNPQETPAQFIEKLGKQCGIQEKEYQPIISMLNNLLYNPSEPFTQAKLKILKKLLQSFHNKLTLQTAN